jgi:hypothetical protein
MKKCTSPKHSVKHAALFSPVMAILYRNIYLKHISVTNENHVCFVNKLLVFLSNNLRLAAVRLIRVDIVIVYC